MKLTIRNQNLAAVSTLDALIETRMHLLGNRVRIDEATVLVERRPESSPAYRVALNIAVPGPDLRAEGVDSTPVQAFSRALSEIEEHLRKRERKRLLRVPGRSRRTSTPGQRATAYR